MIILFMCFIANIFFSGSYLSLSNSGLQVDNEFVPWTRNPASCIIGPFGENMIEQSFKKITHQEW